ncbi:glycosyltransferase [Arthrobacter nitrophenolicus]|uniref:glycosyltransferase n=1 Tax=Arthrobacter nitrophenolicus TaxID=683150 RepID=UPI003899E3E7
MASHNRRNLTLACLRSLENSADNGAYTIRVHLFDDGSSDGTEAAVRSEFSTAEVIRGSGSAFWAAGMAAAERAVLADREVEDDDFLLWLNDDVVLDVDAIQRLMQCALERPGIVVGAVRDPQSGLLTYSGLKRHGWHPLRYERVHPDQNLPIQVDSLNGNVVLVKVGLARKLGGIEGRFAHAFADIDYGIRAMRSSVIIWLAPGTVGTCPTNGDAPRGTISADWASFRGIKGGGNFSSLRLILGRTHPMTWPFYIGLTYCLWWIRRLSVRVIKT